MKIEKLSGPGAKRWMLVDDDEGALSLLSRIVSKLGITNTECFASPKAALAAFKAEPESYEMVITDFHMPGMDGLELSRQLLTVAPGIKILLMTGSGLISNETAESEGFCGLLHKPFHLTAMQNVLAAVAAGKFSTNLEVT
jgi:DNA-binding NtrC family response regulator